MDKLLYYAQNDGIAIERMARIGKFDMSVKHFHNEYEIFFLLEGDREFYFENRSYQVGKGSLILVNENAIHMTRAHLDEDHGHDRIILYVHKRTVQQFDQLYPQLQLAKFFRENYGVYHLNTKQQQQFLMLYKDLQEEFDHKDHNSDSIIQMKIILYFIEFMRQTKSSSLKESLPTPSNKQKTIYAISDYISQNYHEQITLESLATQFYLSKYYLCRSFKEVTGYGLNEFIHIHRIKRAKQLLEETSLSITEVAHQLGYDSLTYFERIFKTYMTISPLKYRKTLNTITYTNDILTTSQTIIT